MDTHTDITEAPIAASVSVSARARQPSILPRAAGGYTHREFVTRAVIYSGLLATSTAAAISLMVTLTP